MIPVKNWLGKNDLIMDNRYLQSLLQDNRPLMLKEGNRYKPDAVHCIRDMLKCNVSASEVGPALQAVAPVCGRSMTNEQLPSRQTVYNIKIRSLAVAHQQMEDLMEVEGSTLCTDKTRKNGKIYMSYAFTTPDLDTKVLGMKQEQSKSVQDTLEKLVDIVTEVSEISGIEGLGETLVCNTKRLLCQIELPWKSYSTVFSLTTEPPC